MTKREINNCTDIEKLKKMCLIQRSQLSAISEILIDESKWELTSQQAVANIRNYLVSHQHDVDLIGGNYGI